MNAPALRVGAIKPETRWSHRVGGLSALAIGLAYLVIVALYARVGAPPTGGQAWLEYLTLADKATFWQAIIGLSVLTNFLYVPVALSLYLALRSVSEKAMLVGVTFIGLFVVLELAVNWTCYASLLVLSHGYAAASEAQRAAYVAAASYPSAVLASRLALVYAIGTLSFGFLVIGLVMLRGVFSKATAYLGVVTGLLGIAAVAGFSVAVILNALCALLWLLFVGYRLFRLG